MTITVRKARSVQLTSPGLALHGTSCHSSDSAGAGPVDSGYPVNLCARTFDERDEVITGRPGTNSYCVLPTDGVALFLKLELGGTPETAAEWYASSYGQQVLSGTSPTAYVASEHSGLISTASNTAGKPIETERGPFAIVIIP